MSFSWDVHRAPDQTASNEAVVDRYDEEGDDVEDEEGGSGVDFWVQLPGMRVGCTGHKCLIGVTGGKGMQVGEDSFGNRQGHREQPDHPHSQTDTECSTGPLDVQRFDNCFVPKRRRDICSATSWNDTDCFFLSVERLLMSG